jgi:hypothetical protein
MARSQLTLWLVAACKGFAKSGLLRNMEPREQKNNAPRSERFNGCRSSARAAIRLFIRQSPIVNRK